MTDFVRDERWLERKHQLQEYFASLEPQHVIVSSLGIPLKYSGYFALIPGNFDVQAHLVQYPLTNYMFVEDNTGHIKAVTRSGSLNNTSLNFDQDRLIYLMGLISSIPAGNKDSITEDGFVSINSTVIRNFFKDYLSYLDYLIQTGVLCTDGIYIQGEKSKGYKFTERYAHAPMVNYEYPAFRQSRLAEAFPIEIYSEEHKDFIPNPLCDYSYLSHWYSTKKLQINEQAATYYAHELLQQKLSQGIETWDINKDKSRGDAIVRKNPLCQYQAALYNIQSIVIGDYKVLIDTNVHRLHSAITNMQKDYRNFLAYDGQELANVDIKNSQPYLACALLNPLFWQPDNEQALSLYSLPQNIQESIINVGLPQDLAAFFAACRADDFIPYKQTVSRGDMYETIMHVCQTHLQMPIQRKQAKTLMFYLLFSSNHGKHDDETINQMKRIFSRELFPQVAALFSLIKHNYRGLGIKKQHNRLACLLQSIESEIILHRCCKRIWEEANGQVPIFTIHDSIATTVEYVGYVEAIMREELTEAVGIAPTLSIEYWKPKEIE